MKCFYHTDQDGYASAYAVKRRHPGERIIWTPSRYGMELHIDKIDENEKIYIVDFSFKPDEFRAILAKTPNVTWIDHHKTVMTPEYEEFQKLPGVRMDGTAACVLTWQYLFPDEEVPRPIKLIGDYDVWKFEYGDDTRHFFAATQIYDLTPDSPFWNSLFSVRHFFNKMLEQGKTVLQYERMQDQRTLDAISYELDFEGYKCLVANVPFKGSEFFNSAEKGKYDVWITWTFKKGTIYTVGLRAGKDGVDVSAIAKKHGGGGHKGAAGFNCQQLPWRQEN